MCQGNSTKCTGIIFQHILNATPPRTPFPPSIQKQNSRIWYGKTNSQTVLTGMIQLYRFHVWFNVPIKLSAGNSHELYGAIGEYCWAINSIKTDYTFCGLLKFFLCNKGNMMIGKNHFRVGICLKNIWISWKIPVDQHFHRKRLKKS